jgi:hypothetical protein
MAINKAINPFISALRVPYVEYIKKVNSDNTVDAFQVETESYTRVYNSKRRREFIFNNLSVWARDMLLAIQYMGIRDQRYLVISYDKLANIYGVKMYNKRRYDSTIRELISYNVIDYKSKEDNQFWYNADILCFSNRLNIYPECSYKISTIKL